jgi:hypothetical protein
MIDSVWLMAGGLWRWEDVWQEYLEEQNRVMREQGVVQQVADGR